MQAQKEATCVIYKLDEAVWENIAMKKLSLMPKPHLTIQTQQIIHDASVMAYQVPQSPDSITPPPQKYTQLPPKPNIIPYMRKGDHNSTIDDAKQSQAEGKSVKSERVAKYFAAEGDIHWQSTMMKLQEAPPNAKQDQMRIKKHKTDQYNKQLREKEVNFLKKRDHRSLLAKQRFRDMKGYTFDYEGKAVSSKSSSQEIPPKVFSLSSHYGYRRINKTLDKKEPPPPKNIIEFKAIGKDEETIIGSMIKMKQEKKAEEFRKKVNESLKEQRESGVFNSMPSQSDMQVGVSVTNLTQQSKVKGRPRNPKDIRSMTLSQFKVSLPQKGTPAISLYGANRPSSSFTIETSQNIGVLQPPYKTEYVSHGQEYPQNRRIRTEQSQRAKSSWGSFGKKRPARGSIQIGNSKLFSEHFTHSRNHSLQQGSSSQFQY